MGVSRVFLPVLRHILIERVIHVRRTQQALDAVRGKSMASSHDGNQKHGVTARETWIGTERWISFSSSGGDSSTHGSRFLLPGKCALYDHHRSCALTRVHISESDRLVGDAPE